MNRIAAVCAAGVIGIGILAGCGGGDSDASYCKELKSAQKEFKDATFTDSATLKKLQAEVEKIAGKAPSAVKSDWETLARILKDPTKATQADVTKLDNAGKKLTKDTKSRCDFSFSVGS